MIKSYTKILNWLKKIQVTQIKENAKTLIKISEIWNQKDHKMVAWLAKQVQISIKAKKQNKILFVINVFGRVLCQEFPSSLTTSLMDTTSLVCCLWIFIQGSAILEIILLNYATIHHHFEVVYLTKIKLKVQTTYFITLFLVPLFP